MRFLNFPWPNYVREFKANKRLQYGLAAILLITLIELNLQWTDRLTNKKQELNRLRGEITALKQQSRDESALTKTLTELDQLSETVDQRLWKIPSEAVGQARLKDWVNDVLARSSITSSTVNLANPRPPGKETESHESRSTNSPVQLGNDKKPSSTFNAPGLREFRATINFVFSPEALEHLLAELESGEPFVTIDSLTVNKRERRAELGIRLLMTIALPALESNSGSKP